MSDTTNIQKGATRLNGQKICECDNSQKQKNDMSITNETTKMIHHCNECGGSHEPSGARSDCVSYWKRRALENERGLASALAEYPLVPKEVWIGTDSDVDRVRWLARRCDMNDRTIADLNKKCGESQKQCWFCDEHEWPYGIDLEGDNRPRCVWCEALRAEKAQAALRDIAAIAEEYNYIGWQRIVSIMQNRSIQALAETEEAKP